MSLIEMKMPKMGESVMEATVIRWLKKEGDFIEQDESVLEVATDKVDTDVPAIQSGYLKSILVREGQVVQIGSPIAIISAEVEMTESVSAWSKEENQVLLHTPSGSLTQSILGNSTENLISNIGDDEAMRFYSPLVLSIAKEEKIGMQELASIKGTGKDGRVTKYDMMDYLKVRSGRVTTKPSIETSVQTENKIKSSEPISSIQSEMVEKQVQSLPVQPVQTPTENVKPAISFSGAYDIIEMDRMRKLIAQRMVDSVRISPHVTTFVEADVTNMVLWRARVKHEIMKNESEPITFTPVFVEAIARTLKQFPLLNSSIVDDKIIVKKDINIGIAVALDDGNLIVPVVKNADQLNMIGLTKKVNSLIKRAKAGKLTPDEVSDGTYTISNVGTFGNLMGTPILVQPQVGIMAIGAIKKKPAVIETETGDTLGIRHMMFLSHSYDHRIIDGALGGMFVKKVSDYLEHFSVERSIYA